MLHRWFRTPQGLDKTNSAHFQFKITSSVFGVQLTDLWAPSTGFVQVLSWSPAAPVKKGGCLDEVACIRSRDFGPLADYSDREHTQVTNSCWSRELVLWWTNYSLGRYGCPPFRDVLARRRAQYTSVCLQNSMVPTLVQIQCCCHLHLTPPWSLMV